MDFIALEPDSRQFAGQMGMIRASVRPPIGFVEIHEHVKHQLTITQPL